MTGFVDPADPAAVEAVLRQALTVLGADALVTQLAEVPELQVQPRRPGRLLRPASPGVVEYGDRRLVLTDGGATLDHVVGGVVLARDPIGRAALPATLAALVCRSVTSSGAHDEVSVLLTALRDAVEIS